MLTQLIKRQGGDRKRQAKPRRVVLVHLHDTSFFDTLLPQANLLMHVSKGLYKPAFHEHYSRFTLRDERSRWMRSKQTLYLSVSAVIFAAIIAACTAQMGSEQSSGAVRIDNDDIGGVVTSAKGPEAGVWVIAETNDLPTRFAKMVVTDDQGRYVMPDLPKASYNVWVRGYGLVDSQKVKASPGNIVNLTAVIAPNEAAAAEYYPSIYWYSMMKIPEKSEFGGKGKIPAKLTSE